MQPKFTQRSFVFFAKRLSLLSLLVVSLSLVSIAQNNGLNRGRVEKSAEQKNARLQEKLRIQQYGIQAAARPVSPSSTNDAGLPAQQTQGTMQPDAVCATFTGALAAGDPTMAWRLNRNGVQGVCPGPKPFASPFSANTYYDTYTWTNNSGMTQCATFTLSTTDAAANIEFGVWSGSFNPADLSVNFLTDPGLSSGTPPTNTVCSANVNAGQTVVMVVFSPNALGTASNYTLTVDMPLCATSPCTGTPAPGNTQSTAAPVCAGDNFTLSLQNATAGSGVTYQWQRAAAAAGPWTDILGATGSTYTTNQTVLTYYRCNVTCSGNTGTSTPLMVGIKPVTECYCIPPASDCTDDDVITRVRISTLDNSSTCGSGPPAGYSNFTSLPAPVVYAGAANPIIVTKPTSWTEGVQVWIDYNQNGVFETTEGTSLGTQPAAIADLTGIINIPTTALAGVTRMRVRINFGSVPTSPCTAMTFGETEDYNVNIQPCVPVTITTQPSSASITCGGNTSFTVATAGSLPVYSWEWRPNSSSAWFTVTNGGIYSGATTTTLTLANVSAAYNGYQYRAVVVGGCSATDVSQSATLTVNPIVPTVTPPSATICTGSVQQLTLTNTLGNTDLISEGFNTVVPAGWTAINRSSPLGTTSWFQGNDAVFPSNSGAANAYAAANYQSTTTVGQISTWLITPSVSIKNGDVLKFWARKVAPDAYADRMQVRMSSVASTNVGATATSVGDFTTLLADINPTETLGVFPTVWTQYTVTVSGLAAPVTGNFAFRYFISNAGSAAANGDYIGLDDVVFTSAGGPAQGVWNGPAGTIFTNSGGTTAYVAGTPLTTVYVKPTVTSNYTVNFTTPTPCTSATTTVPVTVSIPATGLAVAPATRAVCLGGSTTFAASVTAGSPLAYQWQVSTDGGLTYNNVSGATSSTLTISGVTATMSGNRYRFVVTSAPCAAVTSTAFGTLTVNPLPTVSVTADRLNVFPGVSATITASSNPAASTYSWTYNGSPLSGAGSSVTANIDQLGTYTVTSTTAAGCTSSASASITIGAEASDKLWIYPNPNTGSFQVRLYYVGTPTEKRYVNLYNSAGQLVQSKEFDMNSGNASYLRMDFNLGPDARGTYVVKVVDKYTGKITSGLVVIQ